MGAIPLAQCASPAHRRSGRPPSNLVRSVARASGTAGTGRPSASRYRPLPGRGVARGHEAVLAGVAPMDDAAARLGGQMDVPIYQVDAFAGRLFAGNPAAVCPLDRWLPDETMQAI